MELKKKKKKKKGDQATVVIMSSDRGLVTVLFSPTFGHCYSDSELL